MGIFLGNLSVEQIEKRTGIILSDEHREHMIAHRQKEGYRIGYKCGYEEGEADTKAQIGEIDLPVFDDIEEALEEEK